MECDGVTPWDGSCEGRKARVALFIDEHLSRQITSAELADVASMSRFHFTRWFKREFGMSPHRFVACRRGQVAADLIKTTGLPLCEIAYRCGYASQSHMTDSFRKALGLTPGALRRIVAVILAAMVVDAA